MSESSDLGSAMLKHLTTQMDRIETKVDTMQAAIVQMAKTEERVVRLMESDTKKTEWILELQDKVIKLEKDQVGRNAIVSRVERVLWVGLTAALGLYIARMFT